MKEAASCIKINKLLETAGWRFFPVGKLPANIQLEPKTVQGILRHARIQTTLDLYTQDDSDETLAAQGEYLTALGVAAEMVQ